METKEQIVAFHTKHRGPPAKPCFSSKCPQQVEEGHCNLVGLEVAHGSSELMTTVVREDGFGQ